MARKTTRKRGGLFSQRSDVLPRRNPTAAAATTRKTTRARKAPKVAQVRVTPSGGITLTKRPGMVHSANSLHFASQVRKNLPSHRRVHTYRYGVSKSGKPYAGYSVRSNPYYDGKAAISAAAGFGTGLIASDVLDRYIATRKTKTEGEATGSAAVGRIKAKSDGIRVFAQAAATGVAAAGAYLLRDKSQVATYALGGAAVAFAAKGLLMAISDHLMPALLKANASDTGVKGRLAYGLSGPQAMGTGYPRRVLPPFQGKPYGSGAALGRPGCTPCGGNHTATGRAGCNPYFNPSHQVARPLPIPATPTRPLPIPATPTIPTRPPIDKADVLEAIEKARQVSASRRSFPVVTESPKRDVIQNLTLIQEDVPEDPGASLPGLRGPRVRRVGRFPGR